MTIPQVTADAECRSGQWSVTVRELPGLFLQSRRLDQVPDKVRAGAEAMGTPVDVVLVEPCLSVAEEDLLKRLSVSREKTKRAQERASRMVRAAVAMFRDQGMAVRDIASIAGISAQRVLVLQREVNRNEPKQ